MSNDYFAQFFVQNYFGDYYFLEGITATATATQPSTATATSYSDYFLDSFFMPSYYPQYFMDLTATAQVPTTPQSGHTMTGNAGIGIGSSKSAWTVKRRRW